MNRVKEGGLSNLGYCTSHFDVISLVTRSKGTAEEKSKCTYI